MNLRSLGFRTDLMLRRLSGATVDDRGDHLVVRTPANPNFYWGNFLVVPPLGPDDAVRWLHVFAENFPDAGHVAIGIDGTDGEPGQVGPLLEAGLDCEVDVVLTAPTLVPDGRPLPDGVTLRPLRGTDDVRRSVAFRLLADGRDDALHRGYVEARQAELIGQAEAGHGVYVGAFADGELVAELGCFTDGSGPARFQSVETAAAYRRRGLASALLVRAEQLLREQFELERLVIVADPGYVAVDLYRRLGFVDAERQVQCQREPA